MVAKAKQVKKTTTQTSKSRRYLEQIMRGVDPNVPNKYYQAALEIRDAGYEITQDELADFIDGFLKDLKYQPVTTKDSILAAKELAAYENAKLQSISVDVNDTKAAKITPLSEDEVRQFLDFYHDEWRGL